MMDITVTSNSLQLQSPFIVSGLLVEGSVLASSGGQPLTGAQVTLAAGDKTFNVVSSSNYPSSTPACPGNIFEEIICDIINEVISNEDEDNVNDCIVLLKGKSLNFAALISATDQRPSGRQPCHCSSSVLAPVLSPTSSTRSTTSKEGASTKELVTVTK